MENENTNEQQQQQQPEQTQQPQEVTEIPQVHLISVVVPCFNHGKYLAECVDSLLSQTYENIEIIIVNDGSTDNTKEEALKCVQLDKRVRFIDLPENKGKWFALNKAISESNGDLVTCQDADDLALPDRLKRQHDALVVTNSVHNLCGFHHCHSEEDVQKFKNNRVEGDLKGIEAETVAQMVEYGFMTPGINHYYIHQFETAGTSAMFLKALWNIGFRFNPDSAGLRITNSEDSDFNMRVTLALRNTTVLAEPLYLYRRWTGTNNERQ